MDSNLARGVRVSRRRFIGAGAGAASIGLLGPTLWLERKAPAAVAAGGAFTEPPVLTSSSGVLDVTIEAARTTVAVDGQDRTAIVYKGYHTDPLALDGGASTGVPSFPGPTLVVDRGDTIRMKLVNKLELSDPLHEPTNIHTHGLHVSPTGNSDNIFLHIESGESFDYEFDVPSNHPPGLYWYHPHVHGNGVVQMFGGMAGAIVFKSPPEHAPAVSAMRSRVMVLQTTEFDDTGTVRAAPTSLTNALLLINGQQNPMIDIRQGETQRWRFLNASVNFVYKLELDGQPLLQVAADGNPFKKAVAKSELLLVPGARADVLVTGGAPGSYELHNRPFSPGGGASTPDRVVATVVSQSAPSAKAPKTQALLHPFEDLRNEEISVQRTLTLTTAGGFKIDGKEFDAARVDQPVQLDAVEQWTIENPSNVVHPFHIHVNPYQVTHVNGLPIDAPSYEDTVAVAPGGSITFRTRFEDFTGKSVFHCHLIPHSDQGMMGVFEIQEPAQLALFARADASGTLAGEGFEYCDLLRLRGGAISFV